MTFPGLLDPPQHFELLKKITLSYHILSLCSKHPTTTKKLKIAISLYVAERDKCQNRKAEIQNKLNLICCQCMGRHNSPRFTWQTWDWPRSDDLHLTGGSTRDRRREERPARSGQEKVTLRAAC